MSAQDEQFTPLVRTDFSDQGAWQETLRLVRTISPEGFEAYVNVIDDAANDGLQPDDILPSFAGRFALLIVADRLTMEDDEHSLLCIDLVDGRGGFRCVPRAIQSVENNLSIANMDFEDFVDAVGVDGIFRGFEDPA